MFLVSEDLALAHQAELQREAERHSRALRLAAARRWQRRAEAASRRARAALDAIR